ncbi:hypothetical protein P280DRAFT_465575 [Massarina eburnea CBS 473.64]|uniref:Uncharacterized protein n=1 Tax=Massarina eburnea CBS 473.64 TaxID=1395130 RepID=A0A6A6SFY0_9PLEO|nr:hypothetical protein P280DRAFT_465575 [Massarina eburnea CBS 473.64]
MLKRAHQERTGGGMPRPISLPAVDGEASMHTKKEGTLEAEGEKGEKIGFDRHVPSACATSETVQGDGVVRREEVRHDEHPEGDTFYDCESHVHTSSPNAQSSQSNVETLSELAAARNRVATAEARVIIAESIAQDSKKRIKNVRKRSWGLYSRAFNHLCDKTNTITYLESAAIVFHKHNEYAFVAGVSIGDTGLRSESFNVPKYPSSKAVEVSLASDDGDGPFEAELTFLGSGCLKLRMGFAGVEELLGVTSELRTKRDTIEFIGLQFESEDDI